MRNISKTLVADIRGESDSRRFLKREANRIIRRTSKRAISEGWGEDAPRRIRDVTEGWAS